MVWIAIDAGPMQTFAQVFRYVRQLNFKFYVSYLNAALLTLGISILFTGLAKILAPANKLWVFAGFLFIPFYSTINLFVYLSQITVIPHLLKSTGFNAYSPAAYFLLAHFIHLWPESTISLLNGIAYAILGVPSIIYGVLFTKTGRNLRMAGVFLALNGLACLFGLVGIIMKSSWLAYGISFGGILFFIALVPLYIGIYKTQYTGKL